jgi:hypothetical protein
VRALGRTDALVRTGWPAETRAHRAAAYREPYMVGHFPKSGESAKLFFIEPRLFGYHRAEG